MKRNISTIVEDFSHVLTIARTSDLIATVPEFHTENLRTDMFNFPLPLAMSKIQVSLLWHPRFDVDPVHRWLRDSILNICVSN